MRFFSLLMLAAASAAIALLAMASDETVSRPNSATVFQELFEQLGDDSAQKREAALKTLKAKGPAVIESALLVANGENLEAGIRAIQVLETLDESSDETHWRPAEVALLKLVEHGRPSVSRRAQESLNRHAPQRMERAARDIRGLKGQVGNLPQSQIFIEEDDDDVPRVGLIDRNWTGKAAGLEHFARIDTLRALYLLKGHTVPEDDIKAFQQKYPQISLVERGAAFLGVKTGNDIFGCIISEAVDGKPAAQSGLRNGDCVSRIGDYTISTADDLIRAVGEYQPGDVVPFVILRDDHFLYRRMFYTWFRTQDEEWPVLFPMLVLQSMRREVPVTMGAWQLTPWHGHSSKE